MRSFLLLIIEFFDQRYARLCKYVREMDDWPRAEL